MDGANYIHTKMLLLVAKTFTGKSISHSQLCDQQKTTGGVIGGLMNGGFIFGEREMLQERDVDVGGE